MKAAPLASNESSRLADLKSYRCLDTSNEKIFDLLAELACKVLNTPMAGITLVDEKRCWFKAQIGFEVSEAPREFSICSWAVLGKGLLLVPDTIRDPHFVRNPALTAGNVRFYAGAPLISAANHSLGAVFVADHKPRHLSYKERLFLKVISEFTMHVLELRKNSMYVQINALLEELELALKAVETTAKKQDEKTKLISVLRFITNADEKEAFSLPLLFPNLRKWVYV
jgi:GAF domain-containing protein